MLGHTRFLILFIHFFLRAPSGISWDILVEIRKHFPKHFSVALAKSSLNTSEKVNFDTFVKANFS